MTPPRPPRQQDYSTPSDIHAPAGPPTVPLMELRERQLADDQIANAVYASNSTDAGGLLDLEAPFTTTSSIIAETAHQQAQSLPARNSADALGRRMELDVASGRMPRDGSESESPRAAQLRERPLAAVERAHKRAVLENERLKKEAAVVAGHLSGATTDSTGTLHAAPVPHVSSRSYKRTMLAKKGAFVGLEAVVLFFSLRLIVRTHPGPNQLLEETLETIGLVGLALFIIVVGPTLLAHQLGGLRRHPDAAAGSHRPVARWLTIGGIGLAEGGLIILTGVLRALYGNAGITADSELQVNFAWFLLFALVGLGGAFLFTVQVILKNNYQNPYVLLMLKLTELIAASDDEVDETGAEIELRVAEIDFQAQLRHFALDEHDAYRAITLPASARLRIRDLFSTLSRSFGDPHTTDAIIAHQEIVEKHLSLALDDPLAEVLAARTTMPSPSAHPALSSVTDVPPSATTPEEGATATMRPVRLPDPVDGGPLTERESA